MKERESFGFTFVYSNFATRNFVYIEMTNIGLQIINSDSDKDYVTWQTTIPSGSQIRIIKSLPALTIDEWQDINIAVGRTNYYGQLIPQVVTEYFGGQDLYDGQNENGANQLVNLSSAIKQIDLE
ncbi:MAG: hypothetical protein EZS28_035501, partial [Streblomastix strix]